MLFTTTQELKKLLSKNQDLMNTVLVFMNELSSKDEISKTLYFAFGKLSEKCNQFFLNILKEV
ncbi:hypothetical protein GCM10009433_00300 [Psychroflexus lacisalsi]|uniref:Uncharacterized protein n=1 Tax=Psychroflexus lacisalsi TaxID=503928 RepID=A0ABN1K016_9FLAO